MKKHIIRITTAIILTAASMASPIYAATPNAKRADTPEDKPLVSWVKIEPYGYEKKVQVTVHPISTKHWSAIRIKNANNEIVYQEFVKPTEAFSKIYDLNQLGEGVFTMEVSKGGQEVKRSFILDDILHTDALRVIFLAGSDYQHFRIGMENLTKGDVQLEVKDAEGKVVYEHTLGDVFKKVIEKDFSSLKSGEYTVVVHNADNTFSKKLLVP
jgi:hypothetical protein